jgi:hypothetical protein
VRTARQPKPRALAVLLCYNDADVLGDVIEWFLDNEHDVVAWDHGSTDETSVVLDRYASELKERKFIPRGFDFYNLYPAMSEHLIDNYIDAYDWISWPDQDEILEGPRRDRSYFEYVVDVFRSRYNYIRFDNFNFWYTSEDDASVVSPVERVRRYSIFPHCQPRIRAWRASVTNIRRFNHNPLAGEQFPERFNLRHYPMRSAQQCLRRITHDRKGIQRGIRNTHYNTLAQRMRWTRIRPELLHQDSPDSELNHAPIFDWGRLYKASASPPSEDVIDLRQTTHDDARS